MRLAPFSFASVAIALSSVAQAAGDKSFVSAALTKTEDHGVAAGSKSNDDVTIINVTGAFGMGSGFVLGAKYFNYSQDDAFLENANTVISGWGPLVGYYHQSGLFVNLAFLVQPTKEYKTSAGKVTYDGGNGYVIEAGKAFELSSNVGVGVEVAQSHVTYTKSHGSGASSNLTGGEWSDSSFYPYLTLFYFF